MTCLQVLRKLISSREIKIYTSMNKKSINLPVSTRAKVMTEETNLILVLLTNYDKKKNKKNKILEISRKNSANKD